MTAPIESISNVIFLIFVVGIPFYGAFKKINVFDSFVDGAKDGFKTAVQLIPYLVGMLVAIGMLRASGFFDLLQKLLSPVLARWHIPSDIIPLVLVRPFSGSAANGVLADIIHQNGGDSWVSHLAATIMGSTETTFYVVAVYFGAVSIRHTRYAIPVGLMAEFAGMCTAIILSKWIYLT
jgi:spore maturation protein B